MVVLAAFVGMFLLLKPSLLLWFIIIGGLIFAGVAQLYFPEFQFIRWSIGLLAALLGTIALCRYLFRATDFEVEYLPPIFWCMITFIAIAVISSMLNYDGFNTFLFGFKGYFQVWGLFFALLMMGWHRQLIDRIPKVLIAIAFIQLPFALHQYFFIVPGRRYLGHGVVAEDIVAGTLGASATGGGSNAVLSALLLIVIAILAAFYKRNLLSPQRLFAAALILLVPIFLNANKVALVFLMLIYLMLFAGQIRRRVLNTLIMGMFSAMFIVAIFWSYSTLLSRAGGSSDWRNYIVQSAVQNTSEEYGHGGYALNRWTSLTFWIREHRDGSVHEVLLGHGIGAAREGEGGVLDLANLARRKYDGVGIGLTTVSAVLWELGIVGMILLIGLFGTAYRSASWLGRYYEGDLWKASVFEGLRVGVVIFGINCFFQASFVSHLQYQTLFLLLIGYLAYWHAQARTDMIRQRGIPSSPLVGNSRSVIPDYAGRRAGRETLKKHLPSPSV